MKDLQEGFIENLIREKEYDLAEEILQNELLKEYDGSFNILSKLGWVYEEKGRLIEANDAYIRAKGHAHNELDLCFCNEKIEKISREMDSISYSDADYVKTLNKVVSIYCYGRSGTHFFKSLLDGHPKIILTMLNGMKILELWDDLTTKQGNAVFHNNIDSVIAQIFDCFKEFFNEGEEYYEAQLNGMCSMGADRNEIFTIDKGRFIDKFTNIMCLANEVDKKFFYQTVQIASAYGIGYEYNFKTGIPIIVEGGIHFSKSDESTMELIKIFPYTKLLHMVRKPVIAFASALKFLIKSNQASIDNLTANLIAIFADIPLRAEWAERTRIIKLEELHIISKDILQAFCGFMDIIWNDSLLESTFGGIKWWNTLTSTVISGFNTKTISNTYDELLSSFDKFRLEILLRSKYKAWGYETFDCNNLDKISILFEEPFKFEDSFVQDDKEKLIARRIVNKIFSKQFRYENITPEEEKLEFKGKNIISGEQTNQWNGERFIG